MASNEGDLRRVLGPFSAMCVVIGAIIGVGIFFTPKDVAALTGSAPLALLTWGIGGLIALVGGLTFMELGGMYPKSGGQYDILRDAYGTPVGFLFVFCNATAVQAGAIAVIATVFATNLGVLVIGVQPAPPAALGIAIGSIVILAAANIIGVRWGSQIQNLTVVAKLAALVLIILLAVFTATPAVEVARTEVTSPGSAWKGIFSGLVPVLFSIGGWQQGLWLAGEIRQPEKNVPRAILFGVLIVIAVYILANWAYFDLLGYDGVVQSEALAADAVGRVWPQIGSKLIAAAVAISAFGVMNAQLLTGPRLIMSMARDGRFFKSFGEVNSVWRTPVLAIGLLAAVGLALLVVAGDEGAKLILNGVVFIDSTFFLLTGLAVVILRYKMPRANRPVRVPLFPVVPLLFVAGEVVVIIGSLLNQEVRDSSFIGMIWIAVAFVLYLIFFRKGTPPTASSTERP